MLRPLPHTGAPVARGPRGIISSISTGGSGGEDRMTENFSLNFGKVEYEYTPQSDVGGTGTATKSIWDIKAGKAG